MADFNPDIGVSIGTTGLNRFFADINKAKGGVNGLAGSLKNLISPIALIAAGLAIAGGVAVKATKAFSEYEDSLASLSAITGAVGEDLGFFNDAAKRIGTTTTTSAKDALEAFKLIGSAKPELLSTGAVLVSVTEDAITLAEASGQTLPEAAKNLGETLNALNLPASESGRVINVLAAAAQKGAKEIPFVSFALSKFGGIAESAGVSIETSVAAIEILGKAIPEASIVGTNLRGVFIKLQKEAAKQGREFAGLGKELELLAPRVTDVTFLTKTFGEENLLAVQTLIKQREELAKLEEAITGTNSAQEQALINTATFSATLEKLGNIGNVVLITLGEKLNPILKAIANSFISLFNFVKRNIDVFEAIAIGVAAGTAAFIAYKIAMSAAAIQTKIVAAAQFLLNAVLTANPIGLVVVAIAGLVAGLVLLFKRSQTVRAGLEGLFEAAKTAFFGILDLALNVLGGVGDILIGIFTLDLDAIKSGFSKAIGAYAQFGIDVADSFNQGFKNRVEREAAEAAAEALKKETEVVETAAGDLGDVAAVSFAENFSETLRVKLREAFKEAFKDLQIIETIQLQLGRFNITDIIEFGTFEKDSASLTNSIRTLADVTVESMEKIEKSSKKAFQSIKDIGDNLKNQGIKLFEDLAFAIGRNAGESDKMRTAIAALGAQAGIEALKIGGLAFLTMAAEAGFPVGIPLAIAGLALLGASGIAAGSLAAAQAEAQSLQSAGTGGTPSLGATGAPLLTGAAAQTGLGGFNVTESQFNLTVVIGNEGIDNHFLQLIQNQNLATGN